MTATNILGEQIRSERERRAWTQDTLASEIGLRMNKQRLSVIERGHAMPTIDQQIKICELFAATDDEKFVWLLRWLAGLLPEKEGQESTLNALKAAYQKLVVDRVSQFSQTPISQHPGPYCSLEDFPNAFQPITVICGDRREPRTVTRGDLLTSSIAITDIMFLKRLGLDKNSTMVKSDKLTVLMDDDYLKRTFGKTHLLVVGSPAVNHATRLINRRAVFRFDLDPDLVDWEEKLRSAVQLNDRTALEVFCSLIQEPLDRRAFRDREIEGITQEEVDSLIHLAEQLMWGIPTPNP